MKVALYIICESSVELVMERDIVIGCHLRCNEDESRGIEWVRERGMVKWSMVSELQIMHRNGKSHLALN